MHNNNIHPTISMHFWNIWWVCTVCLLPATAILVSLLWHFSLNLCTTFSWTLQQYLAVLATLKILECHWHWQLATDTANIVLMRINGRQRLPQFYSDIKYSLRTGAVVACRCWASEKHRRRPKRRNVTMWLMKRHSHSCIITEPRGNKAMSTLSRAIDSTVYSSHH